MIIKCRLVICLICLLVIRQETIVSLPFSDDVGLHTAPAEVQEHSSMMEQTTTKADYNELFQKSDVDLKAAVCLWYEWDTDVKCTDSQGVFLSIGHCLTYINGKGAFGFKCPYFQLKGHQVSDVEPH